MVRTRNIIRRSKAAAAESIANTTSTEGAPDNEPPISRANLAQEVTRAIQVAMPAILQQIQENTHKFIQGTILAAEKQKKHSIMNEKSPNCNMTKDQQQAEKEDFSECMPEFYGVCYPKEVMRWIFEMENIFKAIKCAEEEDKVKYAVSKLRSEALVWWGTVKDANGPEAKMTWSRFKQVLKDKFCPISTVMQLEEEFLMFKQRNHLTVQEYTARFVEMARYAEHQVATEERKLERYVRGLRTSIRDELVSAGRKVTTFEEAFEAAKEIEENNKKLEEETRMSNLNNKRKWEGSMEIKMCAKCQRSHIGECRNGSKGCYKCGKLGHLGQECYSTQPKQTKQLDLGDY